MMTHCWGIWREPQGGYLRLWSQVLSYLWAVPAVSPEVGGEGDIMYQLNTKKITSLLKRQLCFFLVENWLWLIEMQISRQHIQLAGIQIIVLPGAVSNISCCMMCILWCPSCPKNVLISFHQHLPVPPPVPVCKPLACSSTAVLGHSINHIQKNWGQELNQKRRL